MQRVLTAILLSFLSAPLLAGEKQSPSVDDLVRRLDSDKFAVRSKAADLLRQRGPVILPQLRAALKGKNLEVHLRLRQIIEHLEYTVDFEPARVTFGKKNWSLKSLLDEIEQQTKCKVYVDKKYHERRIVVALKNATFWEAVAAIEKATGLTAITTETNGGQIHLVDGRRPSPFTVNKGPFRLRATRIHEDRDLDWTKFNDRGKRRIALTISITAEPRMGLFAMEPPVVEVAVDEERRKFIVAPQAEIDEKNKDPIPTEPSHYKHPNNLKKTIVVLLSRPAIQSAKIQRMRLAVPTRVVVRKKPIVVTEHFLSSKGTSFQIGEDKLTIEMAARNKEGNCYYRIRGVKSYGMFSIDIRWYQRIHLLDTLGKRFRPNRNHGVDGRGAVAIFSRGFYKCENPGLGPPQRLVVEDWIVRPRVIRFEMTNLPLP